MFIWKTIIVYIFSSITFGNCYEEFRPLDDYILHHEDINYDVSKLQQHHHRSKRSTTPGPISLEFKAFGKYFHLLLEKENGIFSKDHKLQYGNEEGEPVDTSFIYKGTEKYTPKSKVYGSIINGIFRGSINIPGDTRYHIEAADKYKPGSASPCIIYREKDMNFDPYRKKREALKQRGGCALDRAKEWMRSVTESVVRKPIYRTARASGLTETNNEAKNKYAEEHQYKRQKREVVTMLPDNTCYMLMKSDPLFYTYIKTQGGTTKSDQQTQNEILEFFASHVKRISEIYTNTEFVTTDETFGYKEVNFAIQQSTIMTPTTEKCNTPEESRYCAADLDVSYFLDLHSQTDYSAYCLAYLFTYRDFTAGTLGLAWLGSSTGNAGGICEKYTDINVAGGGTVKKSLNTGVITTLNFKKRVAPSISQLSLAHEVGHNFGAQHDSTPECAPYGTTQSDATKGNYIMFPSSNSGERENNVKFSSCSRDSIARVLKVVLDDDNKKCFKKTDTQFCGNLIVETGEECDCGDAESCKNSCCNERNSADECKLKANNVCSSGPCCNNSCQYVPASENLLCKTAVECSGTAYCDGTSEQCPTPSKSADGTLCQNKTLVCKNGECAGSVCSKINWLECVLSGNDADIYQMCYLSCQKTETSECISSADTVKVKQNAEFENLLTSMHGEVKGVKVAAGSPCNNYFGYCTEFNYCKTLNSEGPFRRLTNLLLSESTMATVLAWMKEYWWAVALMALGLILFLALVIKVCGRSTVNSYPYKRQIDDRHERREMDERRKRSRSPEKYHSESRDDNRRKRSERYEEPNRVNPRRERMSREERYSRESYNQNQRPSRTSHQSRHSQDHSNSYNVDRRGPPPPYSAHASRYSREYGNPGGYLH